MYASNKSMPLGDGSQTRLNVGQIFRDMRLGSTEDRSRFLEFSQGYQSAAEVEIPPVCITRLSNNSKLPVSES